MPGAEYAVVAQFVQLRWTSLATRGVRGFVGVCVANGLPVESMSGCRGAEGDEPSAG